MAEPYLLEALNLYDQINIKAVRSLVSGKVVDSTPHELQVTYGERSYLFVYRFGCLVFFNVPKEKKDAEMERLRAALGPGLSRPTQETYQIVSTEGPNNVEFEYVELKKLDIDSLRIVAFTLGQSAALEYFEIQAERMLADTSTLMTDLSKGRRLPVLLPRGHLNLIGSTAGTRQHIIANLAILDPPEITWKSKELEKLYAGVRENFDIEVRFRILDRKLTLVLENIEILVDLSHTQRTTILETLVVLLIVVEILLAFLMPH